ncbi:MAG: tetratricopeptide repeat protein [Coxiellaceae bacterium]|nr:tetratricopeptide repeat protein [Coxiellaceae bacterium]
MRRFFGGSIKTDFEKGLNAYKQSEYGLAIACFDMAEAENTSDNNVALYYYRGRCRSNLNKHAEAINDLERFNLLMKQSGQAKSQYGDKAPLVFNMLGKSYASLGQLAKAVIQYENAIKQSPTQPALYFNLLITLLDLKQYDRILTKCDAGIEQAQVNLTVFYYFKAKALFSKKQYGAARVCIESAFAQAESSDFAENDPFQKIKIKLLTHTRCLAISVYYKLGKYKVALQLLSQVARQEDVAGDACLATCELADVKYHQALIFRQQDKLKFLSESEGSSWKGSDRAIKLLDQAIRLYPNNSDYYAKRARELIAAKKILQAIPDIRKAVELNEKKYKEKFKKNAWLMLLNDTANYGQLESKQEVVIGQPVVDIRSLVQSFRDIKNSDDHAEQKDQFIALQARIEGEMKPDIGDDQMAALRNLLSKCEEALVDRQQQGSYGYR